MTRARGGALAFLVVALGACSNVLGLRDLELDPLDGLDGGDDGAIDGGADTSDGALVDGAHDGSSDGSDGSVDATTDAPSDASRDTSATDAPPSDSSVGCDAGQTMCTSGCVDTRSDGANCGGCNHDCLGGACTSSACQPVRVAFSQPTPWDLAVDGTSLYFTAQLDGTVRKCATSGCGSASSVLASGQTLPQRVTFDATYVYFTDHGTGAADGAVRRVLKSGGGLATLVSGELLPEGVAVDAANVFWAMRTTSGGLRVAAIGGGAGSTIAAADTPTSVVYDGASVFFASAGATGAVKRCGVSGATCASLTSLYSGASNVFGLAVDATNVYFATLDASGTVTSALKSNGSGAQPLAGAQPWPLRLVTDGVDVVWVNRGPSMGASADGSVMRCAVGGCGGTPATVASGQADPHGVAIDAKAIYWANASDGSIWKVAR